MSAAHPQVKSRKIYTSAKPWEAKVVSIEQGFNIQHALKKTRERMGKFYEPAQLLGRRDTIGCVALEITQRCNLDCTLCYLSENSESTKDIPIQKLFERLEKIQREYGPGTSVQITGGDPTLRSRPELVAIVKKCRDLGMNPALFTNGIKATRDLLQELASVGLGDVAFHVDLTQERKGYNSEKELNVVRQEYIERARGLPIAVLFNTTVCDKNFHEIPEVVKFFVKNADAVNMASFQMQADTGRGEMRQKDAIITLETVRNQISKGAETSLAWDVMLIGHHDCNRYAPVLVVGDKVFNMIEDKQLYNDFLEEFKDVTIDRRESFLKIIKPYVMAVIRKPSFAWRGLKYLMGRIWVAKGALIANGGKFQKLSLFIHNFMDAEHLECERIDTCSFMVMTEKGPVSMCAHNAKRDEYILQPLKIQTESGEQTWDPLAKAIKAPTRQIPNAYQGVVGESK